MTAKDAMVWCLEFEDNLEQAGSKEKKYTLAKDAVLTCELALMKQVPITPNFKRCGNLVLYSCGGCGAVVDRSRHKHCEKCGQKIDWKV